MDEERQPDNGTAGHAEPLAWRVNGAPTTVGGHHPDHGWSNAGAALEPSTEPLSLLASGPLAGGPAGPGGDPAGGAYPSGAHPGSGAARHRQEPSPGLDDETPADGLPVVEPPLWREAARYSPGSDYRGFQPEYRSPPSASPPLPRRAAPAGEGRLSEGRHHPSGHPQPGAAEPAADPEPTPAEPAAVGTAEPADRADGPAAPGGLPQRVPSEPDVPVSGEPEPTNPTSAPETVGGRERWSAPELAWIADQLRRDDVPGEAPAEPFDVDAVVSAVREVAGVRAASVRPDPTGIHTLRLDLADEADPGQVSNAVARLLLERMGLSATQHVPHARLPEETVGAGATGGWHPEHPPRRSPSGRASVSASPRPGPARHRPASRPTSGGQADIDHGHGATGAPDPRTARPEAGSTWLPGVESESAAAWPDSEALFEQPEPVSRPLPTDHPGPRVLIDQVQVSTFGLEAYVEVRLTAGPRQASGVARGPAVDSYLVRLASVAAAKAIDELLRAAEEPGGPSRCFIEHTGLVSFGSTEVAVAVVLLVCGGWVEQLTGSALVDGDPRQAVVRATLSAVNRRLEALLSE